MADYTKERKGKIILSKPILVCPKCGRKGLRNRSYTDHKGIRQHYDLYIHVSEGVIRDYCHITLEKEAIKEAVKEAIWICRKGSDPVKVESMDAAALWVAKKINKETAGPKVFRYIGHGAYEWASYVVGPASAMEAHGFQVGVQKSES